MGYAGYFLIVADFVNFARGEGDRDLLTRVSPPGFLVTYTLGIAPVDPLHYDLLFEHFLNPYRPSMPDIDIDFEDARRDEVIEYVTNKYGEDNVAQIITFGAMHAQAAIRDVHRVKGMTYGEVDRISSADPGWMPPLTPITIARLELVPERRRVRYSDNKSAEVDRHRPPPGGADPQRGHPRTARGIITVSNLPDDLCSAAERHRWWRTRTRSSLTWGTPRRSA